jgi:hypothetical protein
MNLALLGPSFQITCSQLLEYRPTKMLCGEILKISELINSSIHIERKHLCIIYLSRRSLKRCSQILGGKSIQTNLACNFQRFSNHFRLSNDDSWKFHLRDKSIRATATVRPLPGVAQKKFPYNSTPIETKVFLNYKC